jgi:hypothetical protein
VPAHVYIYFPPSDSNAGDNGGAAQYVNGISEGLAYTSGSQVILAVDTAENVAARNSLRMVSKTTFNAKDMNLFIFDIAQMPAVCGTVRPLPLVICRPETNNIS